MSAKIILIRPRPAEPIHVMDPQPERHPTVLCVALWIGVPICFWGAVFAMLHWRAK